MGASSDDSAQIVKEKYRAGLLRNHPDRGGSHEDFLELQASIDYIANKRASVATATGKQPLPSASLSMGGPADGREIEGTVALEAGQASVAQGSDPQVKALTWSSAGLPDWSETAVQAILGKLDQEMQDYLQSAEFEMECKRRFDELDANGNGVLDGEELIQAVTSALPTQYSNRMELTRDSMKELIKSFDANVDGKIQLEEFSRFSRWVMAVHFKELVWTNRINSEMSPLEKPKHYIIDNKKRLV